jgi:hypothetical protein
MEGKENLRLEYKEICENWRYLVDQRFKIFQLFYTVTSGLAVAFVVLKGRRFSYHEYLVPFLGILTAAVTWMLDTRRRILDYTILSRGKELESNRYLSIGEGQFTKLDESAEKGTKLFGKIPITYTLALRVLYLSIIVLWVLVLVAPGE